MGELTQTAPATDVRPFASVGRITPVIRTPTAGSTRVKRDLADNRHSVKITDERRCANARHDISGTRMCPAGLIPVYKTHVVQMLIVQGVGTDLSVPVEVDIKAVLPLAVSRENVTRTLTVAHS